MVVVVRWGDCFSFSAAAGRRSSVLLLAAAGEDDVVWYHKHLLIPGPLYLKKRS